MEALGERKRTRKEMELPAWEDYMQEIIQEKEEAYLINIYINR
jgi:effector-binding domain-containing protein